MMISLEIEMSEFAWANLTNDDHAQLIADAYPSHTITASYDYSAATEAVLWPNDRAQPGDGEEIEIHLDAKEEAEKIVAAIAKVVDMTIYKMSDSLYQVLLGLIDFLDEWKDGEDAAELVRAAEQGRADQNDEDRAEARYEDHQERMYL